MSCCGSRPAGAVFPPSAGPFPSAAPWLCSSAGNGASRGPPGCGWWPWPAGRWCGPVAGAWPDCPCRRPRCSSPPPPPPWALAAAMGMVAFERDLSGYGFGLRQVAALVAAAGVALATVPVAWAAVDGDWDTPDSDFTRTLSFMEDGEVTARAGRSACCGWAAPRCCRSPGTGWVTACPTDCRPTERRGSPSAGPPPRIRRPRWWPRLCAWPPTVAPNGWGGSSGPSACAT